MVIDLMIIIDKNLFENFSSNNSKKMMVVEEFLLLMYVLNILAVLDILIDILL
jgi:hypothetical protein